MKYFLIFFLNFLFVFSIQAKENYAVINIATKTLRVYQTDCLGCPAQMIMQIPVVVGKKYSKSWQGRFEVSSWELFYQDKNKKYIPWNIETPPKGSKIEDWAPFKGAFGWYAMMLKDMSHGQWVHGTYGYGKESIDFILKSSGSKGCIRTSNPAINKLKKLLPKGSKIYKIYSNEVILDQTLSNYGKEMEKKEKFYFKQQNVIDYGKWSYLIVPKIVSGNIYNVEEPLSNFYIDNGLIDHYLYPKSLPFYSKDFEIDLKL